MADRIFFTTAITVVTAALVVLGSFTVALRLYARRLTRVPLLTDDWTIIVALLLAWACGIVYWVFAYRGSVHAADDNLFAEYEDVVRFTSVFQTLSNTLTGMVKISVLYFYKRIFITRAFQRTVWTLIAIIVLWTLANIGVSIFWNHEIYRKFSSEGIPTGINEIRYSVVVAGIGMVLDMTIVALPLFMISRLQMPLRQKIAVSLIFALGVFCCTAAALRFVTLYQAVSTFANGNDFPPIVRAYLFTILDLNVAIIAASLPSLGIFLSPDGPLRKRTKVWSARVSSLFSASPPRSGRDVEASGDSILANEFPLVSIDSPEMLTSEGHKGQNVLETRSYIGGTGETEIPIASTAQKPNTIATGPIIASREAAKTAQEITITQAAEP